MTRTVSDAALMLNVISLPDDRDWFSLPHDPRDYTVGLDDGVRGLRIAYSADLGYAKVDREVAAIVKKAVQTFADLGARVEAKGPGFENMEPVFRTHWFAAAAHVYRGFTPAQRKMIDPGLREVALQGSRIGTMEYLDAVQKRGALGVLMNRFHETFDLLVTPTLAVPAFEAGREVADVVRERRWTDWTPFSYPFNLTQQPAASIPCGFTKSGLPVGLHIVGPRHADALVLRAARAFESAHPIRMPDITKLTR
jgi:aspartyl-tRNA(Asn)/glutamyl-tRNA(Gln) amidotransferase subunit A